MSKLDGEEDKDEKAEASDKNPSPQKRMRVEEPEEQNTDLLAAEPKVQETTKESKAEEKVDEASAEVVVVSDDKKELGQPAASVESKTVSQHSADEKPQEEERDSPSISKDIPLSTQEKNLFKE